MTNMQNLDGAGSDNFQWRDTRKVENADELELAYKLENAIPGDPQLLREIIRRYAGEVYRWVAALWYYTRGSEATQEQIMGVLKAVFAHTIFHPEQFQGKSSVLNWLLATSYPILKKQPFTSLIQQLFSRHKLRAVVSAQGKIPNEESLATIPEKLRLPLILRVMLSMGLEDIAEILDLQTGEAQQRLVSSREGFITGTNFPDPKMRALLHGFVDGQFDDTPEEKNLIVQHIDTCVPCRRLVSRIQEVEKSLAECMQRRFRRREMDRRALEELAALILACGRETSPGWSFKAGLRQAAWIGGLSVLAALLGFIFIRLTPVETEFPSTVTTSTPQLPPVIGMQPELSSYWVKGTFAPVPQYIDPALSSDGKWAVLAFMQEDLATMNVSLPTISVYNLEDETIQVISENTTTLKMPWLWWDLAPSISGDGQHIVYVSTRSTLEVPGYPCKTHDGSACLDIFLYDQATHSTSRLTQAVYGGAADGDNLAPVLSRDGNWVAFWSAADNLVTWDQDKIDCQQGAGNITCLYPYLYQVQDGKITQLPVQNKPGNEIFGADHISLSADGRYVGITAVPVTQSISSAVKQTPPFAGLEDITSSQEPDLAIPSIQQSSEAVIYDQHTDKYELVNTSQNGIAGDGPSSSPVLSADGRYVAFISNASNLVSGDENHASDIFIKDRQTGKVELVSISTIGEQGNNDSGTNGADRGLFSLDLSADGRYVVFISKATNLDQGVEESCNQLEVPSCYRLYLRDTQKGRTDLLSVLDERGYIFFPEISADGRWVSFTQYTYNCGPRQYICSNVMLFDRQRDWLSSLTKYDQHPPGLPWSESVSLELPWPAWESRGLTFSPDGSLLAVGGYDAKIRIWKISGDIHSVRTDQPDVLIQADDSITAVAFSQDSSWLAAGTTGGIVEVWNLQDRTRLFTFPGMPDPIKKIVFTPDGTHLLISTQYELWIWGINGGEMVAEADVPFGTRAIFASDVSPRGNMLATGRGDGTIWLQELPSGKVIARLGGLQVAVYDLVFSPDGSLLAARSAEGITSIWNIEEDEAGNRSFKLFNQVQSNEYAGEWVFSPDNTYLASTGIQGQVTLFGVLDGKFYSLVPPIPFDVAYGVAFSKEGDFLVAMFQNQLVLWGIATENRSSFFTLSTTDTFLGSPPLPSSTANDIPELRVDGLARDNLTIAEAAGLVNFPLLVPVHLPQNIKFLDAAIYNDGSITLCYVIEGEQTLQDLLFIYERPISELPLPNMTVGKSAVIQADLVNTGESWVKAEYVQGDWHEYTGNLTPNSDSSTKISYTVWNWNNLLSSQRLRWQQGGELVALYHRVNMDNVYLLLDRSLTSSPLLLSRDDLVQIGSGMIQYGGSTMPAAWFAVGQNEKN